MPNVFIPPALEKYQGLLAEFFAGMVYKLDLNSHKDTPTREHVLRIVELLRVEIEEFLEQLTKDKYDSNSLVELFDTANFAFLAYVALRRDGVSFERQDHV